ncbi:unnamed protein product [Zymoseptoria tritici ST99CH_1A5]|nr:unnamed protein product [Zymoseptoria tritici ST99CH_1A5]
MSLECDMKQGTKLEDIISAHQRDLGPCDTETFLTQNLQASRLPLDFYNLTSCILHLYANLQPTVAFRKAVATMSAGSKAGRWSSMHTMWTHGVSERLKKILV